MAKKIKFSTRGDGLKERIYDLLVEGKSNSEIQNTLRSNRWRVNALIAEVQNEMELKIMVKKTIIKDGVTIQKLKPGYAYGGEPLYNKRY